MNITSILNGISIGKDVSGNFKLSIEGLAVRTSTDDKFFYLNKEHRLVDACGLTFDGADAYIYRVPVPEKQLKPGDLIITSEDPFRALFVLPSDTSQPRRKRNPLDADSQPVESVGQSGQINGLDPATNQIVVHSHPRNLFIEVPVYVKVVSLLDGFNGGADTESFLPFLLWGNKGDNSAPDDAVNTLLIMKAIGAKDVDKKLLPLLLLGGSKSGGLETILLMQALRGGDLFGGLFGSA